MQTSTTCSIRGSEFCLQYAGECRMCPISRLVDSAEYGKHLVDIGAGEVAFKHYNKTGRNNLPELRGYDGENYGVIGEMGPGNRRIEPRRMGK